jgi:mannose/cellobiose epimerase-like protein (N-acyl-D-glucosamine 2-epimerase family)
MGLARSPVHQALISLSTDLVRWLHEDALPLWDLHGVDRDSGGYFENLVFDSEAQRIQAAGDIRRGRVVARQIFVFDAGARLGWRSRHADPIRHGCDYLFSRLHRGEGLFHTSVDALTHKSDGQFSLYETAFYLFALARLHATLGNEFPAQDTALACLAGLRAGWGRAQGGFEESNPPTQPLKSNPHMHLLEAALAWTQAAANPQKTPWVDLAQELVELCCTRLIDSKTHAIREYFDADWRPFAGEMGEIVEPGHQFEWAWLLMQWASSHHSDESRRAHYRTVARRLVEVGELKGVDAGLGVARNELWSDLTPKDLAAKLWPQTERLKAWCAMFECATTPDEAQLASMKIHAAAAGMTGYFFQTPKGMWHELLLPDGTFSAEPCKASSLYHIVCAIETLQQTANSRNTRVLC